MSLLSNKNLVRWVIIFSSFIIISLILWNTYSFFQKFKAEERTKMKNWSFAYPEYAKYFYNDHVELNKVADKIVTDTTITTPLLLVDKDDNILWDRNIDSTYIKNPELLNTYLSELITQNKPIAVTMANGEMGKLYYGDSPLLNKLKYYPLALLLIIILFGGVVYFFYRSSKNAEQNKLWTGMAKETAHQIGTPLSSLIGWTEILKSEQVNPDYIYEIEKDINRLQTITDRFSKIGSIPTLKQNNIVAVTQEAVDYLQARASNLINFTVDIPEMSILVWLNIELYSWTIENVVKNAIDAMRGKGHLNIKLTQIDKKVFITISDTGKGIPKSQFKTIFDPGFTTKQRGWGLGLSLAKRIIADYHKGKIKVLSSKVGKGTSIQIILKVA